MLWQGLRFAFALVLVVSAAGKLATEPVLGGGVPVGEIRVSDGLRAALGGRETGPGAG